MLFDSGKTESQMRAPIFEAMSLRRESVQTTLAAGDKVVESIGETPLNDGGP
jgi:hypothetical protein